MKRAISVAIFVVLLFTAAASVVFAYSTPFDVPEAAHAGAVNQAARIEYSLREGGTFLYCNNPERLFDADVEKALMIEHDLHGKVFFTNENICAARSGYYLGLQLRNHSGKPVSVTVHNIGYQVGEDWVGQQEWTDFFQTTFELEDGDGQYAFSTKKSPHAFQETTYTVPDGKYIYVMGGTTHDAYGGVSVAGSADRRVSEGQVVNGVVYFTVNGPEKGVDAAFVCYSSSSYPVTTDEQQGYVVSRGGESFGRQYLGSAPVLCAEASMAWNIDDSFADGKNLPVTYKTTYYGNEGSFGNYEAYTSPKTATHTTDWWMTHLNPESDRAAVGTDMMPFYCVTADTGESVVIDTAHNDGTAKHANIGNWMVVYEESMTFENSGKTARTFTLNMTIKGVAAVNIRDKDGKLIESVYHFVSGPVYTHTVMPYSSDTFTVEYVLLANSYGNISHSVTVGTADDPIPYGDPNGDGKIDAFDYLMVKSYVLGTFPKATKLQILAMDANRDGEVDAIDYFTIKRIVLEGVSGS